MESLVLGGRANASLTGEVVEKHGDLLLAHDRRVTTAVEKHKSPDPRTIRDLRALAVMAEPKTSANLLE